MASFKSQYMQGWKCRILVKPESVELTDTEKQLYVLIQSAQDPREVLEMATYVPISVVTSGWLYIK